VVTIIGNTATPGNVIINPTGAPAITVKNAGRLTITGIELRGNVGLYSADGGVITVSAAVRFGPSAAYQMNVERGRINLVSNYTISGGAIYHMNVGNAGYVFGTSITVTLTGSPAFSGAFLNVSGAGAQVNYYLNTFSGAATGPRYTVQNGGWIAVNGAGVNYLPGSTAGSGTNFGVAPYGLYS